MQSRIDAPGIYAGISNEDYHAEICPAPALTGSLAATIIDKSPLHAWHQHPKLNPNHAPDGANNLDFGRAAHAMVLEGRDIVDVVDESVLDSKGKPVKSFQAKAAQEMQAESRKNDRAALFPSDYDAIHRMRAAYEAFCSRVPQLRAALDDGIRVEHSAVWQEEGGFWCRARPDVILPEGERFFINYKTTSGSAQPAAWAANNLYSGNDISDAFYTRGLRRLGLDVLGTIFVVQEKTAPFACSAVAVSPEGQSEAMDKVEDAIRIWSRCLVTDEWPGYPTDVYHHDISWMASKRRAVRDDAAEAAGVKPFELGFEMQKPLPKREG